MLFIDQLDLLNTQLRAITKRVRDLLAGHPDAAIFLSFPGLGHVTAATMLAEMGEDRGRFPTADVLLAETGTAPVTRSGGHRRTVRFRHAANKRMRHATDWWAFVSVRENDWAHDANRQARARGQLHNRALRSIGARWTRILWRCWVDGVPHDPAQHDPAQHLKNQPTAAISA
jgi:transposase